LNKYDEALSDTEESIALYPGNFKTLRTRARIHLHLENLESSVADFKAALEQAKFEDNVTEVRALQTELKKAEAALKRSKTKDYYKILGVSKDCTEAEIKKAYRKESLIHHPDKGGDEEKFKLVAEAFSVLSDPQRRQRYDLGEEDSEYGGGSGGMGGMNPQDFADLFAQFGGGMPNNFSGGGYHNFHTNGSGRGFPF
jgi:DnaJ family protein C protein 7